MLDYKSIELPLNYPCKTGLPAAQVDAIAAQLRADHELVGLLRLRITNINSAVGVWVMSTEVVDGMKALGERKP